MDNNDVSEILSRALKYLIEGLAVGLCCYFLQQKLDHIIIIAITAATSFAILDMYSPRIGESLRFGLGASLGTQYLGLRVVGAGPKIF
jgi:hypothetical protein